ncbi:MAG: DUF5681 domain-containing protein [Pseudomonadota bacterium]
MTENAPRKQSGNKPWQFKKGQSGNPAGKPKGTRHRATRAVEALMEGEADAITRKAIDAALAGDMTAIKLCLDRIAPPRKGAPVGIQRVHMAAQPDPDVAPASAMGPDWKEHPMAHLIEDDGAFVIVLTAGEAP